MSQYQRLLLIIDPALRNPQSINHAAALAKASGARLHIAGLVKSGDHNKTDHPIGKDNSLLSHRNWLTVQANNLKRRGIDVTTEVILVDDLEKNMLDHVMHLQPDLIIKEVQHQSALKRVLFTPIDWQLLRQCPVPVYLVSGNGFVFPRKIVAAVEVSDTRTPDTELNDRIISQATAFAHLCKAELHLLYAWDNPAAFLGNTHGNVVLPVLARNMHRSLASSFITLADRHGLARDHRHFLVGHHVKVLSQFAVEQHIDVIVMGRVQSRGLHKLLGSTTEHIIYEVPCCVLAI